MTSDKTFGGNKEFKKGNSEIFEISTGIADSVKDALKDKEFFTEGIGIVNMPPTAKELELQQEIFNIKFKYDSLLNFLKPFMPHDMLVAFADKKKEIFG